VTSPGTAWLAGGLLLGASIYLGLAFTEVFLEFPGALRTTHAQNFPERFGGPVRRAVAFFAVLSGLMFVGGIVLTIGEWDQGARRWGPLAFTIALVLATLFTVVLILPVNRALYREITDEGKFHGLLARWIRLNTIRAGIWVVEWVAIALWFVAAASDRVP
jgi:hypothetical protein